ncbi:hypothetical protein [Rubrobacter calidifluminis]|uniref:hypothetical protein n=1 Tax=Rubrobacter calidifluminis TaxID=1392640 RepID=UPI00235E99FE|nr:hypothetical protein [Rubrobacter calidifluminis]
MGLSQHGSPLIPAALSGAAGAARMLREACAASDGLRLRTTGELAADILRELRALEENAPPPSPHLLAEAAGSCADLATLAACALPHIGEEHLSQVAAAVHLASGSAKALGALGCSSPEDYVLRDARSAAWRAELAAGQADEALQQAVSSRKTAPGSA